MSTYQPRTTHWITWLLFILQIAAQRPVTLIVDFDGLKVDSMSREKAIAWIPSHAQLHINGTSTDGPLRLSIIDYGTEPNFKLSIDAFDWGVANRFQAVGVNPGGSAGSTRRKRELIELGDVDVTNAKIIDVNQNAGGILAKIAKAAPFEGGYMEGRADCMHFVQALVRTLFPTTPSNEEFDGHVRDWEEFVAARNSAYGRKAVTSDLGLVVRQVTVWGDKSKNVVDTYKFDSEFPLPVFVSHEKGQGTKDAFQDSAGQPEGDQAPLVEPWEERAPVAVFGDEGEIVASPWA